MSKQQRGKLIEACKSRKNRQEKPFVQIEGKLTQAQLEAIAAGRIQVN